MLALLNRLGELVQALMRFLFGKRTTRLRGLAIVPGVVALLFVGHAYEDSGPEGAMLYVILILLSITYVIRPMVVAWLPLFLAFAAYSFLVGRAPWDRYWNEWLIFLLIGIVPTISLWLARPRGLQRLAVSREDR